MRTMTIGKRISLACVTFVALTGVQSSMGWYNSKRITQNVRPITAEIIPALEAINPIDAGSEGLQRLTVEYIYATTQDQVTAYESEAKERVDEILQGKEQLEKSVVTDRGHQVVARLRPALDRFLGLMDKCLTLCRANKKEEAAALYKAEGRRSMDELDKVLGDAGDLLRSEAQGATDMATSTANSTSTWAWLMLAFSIAGGGAVTSFTIRGVTRALSRMMNELSGTAEQVAGTASQVSRSSQSLAQGSSEQAASLEETSASSEQINAMASKNSENSREVAGLVIGSQERFFQTNQSLEQTVVAMGEIHTQSGKISKIIKVIDEIAFQTNILALNAAVEAARAGEAGMGFAVVAEEVRNLAQRSAQAAKDTAELIEESISKSNDGKLKVDQVAAAIRLITEEFGKVKTVVDEVNQGSQEQTRGIQQVAKAVIQMQRVTQSTAAGAEESAAAAEELKQQSEALKDVVRRLTAMLGGG